MDKRVENFKYNGFMVESREGYAPYTADTFIGWTNDPGVGEFKCSDGKERRIPSCQISTEYRKSLPPRPKLNPLKGEGVLFGRASES